MRLRMMMPNHFYPCCMVFEKYPTFPHERMSNNSLAEGKVERVKRLLSCHPVHSHRLKLQPEGISVNSLKPNAPSIITVV